MPRAKIHASATERWHAHDTAEKAAGRIMCSIRLDTGQQAALATIREHHGITSNQAAITRLIEAEAKKIAKTKKDA